jgi:8-oxo-dGTP diphosphatase
MTTYVVGFLFSTDLKKVVLVEKNRPEWQAGLLNGVGGKVEQGESPLEAMIREFNEEAGATITQWKHYANMSHGDQFSIDVFATTGDLNQASTKTDEFIGIYELAEIQKLATIENIPWLLLLAKDVLQDYRPDFVTVKYSKL